MCENNHNTTESADEINVIPYEERYVPDFIRLNRAWLEDFGLLEEADEKKTP